MAAVLLFLFQRSGYGIPSYSFFLIAAAAFCLPMCLGWIEKRSLFSYPAQFVSCGVSLVITLLYMHETAANATAREDMARAFVLIHAIALLGTLVRYFLRKKENA